jgi:hypothetical protein
MKGNGAKTAHDHWYSAGKSRPIRNSDAIEPTRQHQIMDLQRFLNYIPTHVRPAGSIRPAAMLVRGTDRFGHFKLVEMATAELDPEGVAVHDRAVALYRDCYLEAEAGHALLSA